MTGWWFQPIWKIWKLVGMIIPIYYENNKCLKPPTRWVLLEHCELANDEIKGTMDGWRVAMAVAIHWGNKTILKKQLEENLLSLAYIYIRYVSENGTHILTSPATLNLQLLPQVSVRESSDHWFFSINSRKWAWKSIKWTLSNIHSRNPLVPPNESLIGFFSTQWVPSGNLT